MYAAFKKMNIAKGLGIGLAVGAAAALIGAGATGASGGKACKRKALKCMRGVENAIENVASMIK